MCRTSLEINHKPYDVSRELSSIPQNDRCMLFQIVKKSQAGGGVAVKIEHAVYQSAKMFGRHFDDKDELLSHITRQSIDVLKVYNSSYVHVHSETLSFSRHLRPMSPTKSGFLLKH